MTLVERLARDRFLPVVVLDDVDEAEPLADALVAGGLGTVEVTLRTPAGLPALRRLAGRSDLLVGAGTVVEAEQVDAVVAAGARFVVTPGFDHSVVHRCRRLGVPVLPGVATASEVMAALSLGVDVVKLFPAGLLGGPAMVDALAGPFPGLRVVPSGGVTADSAPEYLARPSVPAVSGSWVTPRDLRSLGGPDGVRAAAARTLADLTAAGG